MPIRTPQFRVNLPAPRDNNFTQDLIQSAFNQALNFGVQSRIIEKSQEATRENILLRDRLSDENLQQRLALEGVSQGTLIPKSRFGEEEIASLETTAEELGLAPPSEIELGDRTFFRAGQIAGIQETARRSQPADTVAGHQVVSPEDQAITTGEAEALFEKSPEDFRRIARGDVEAARAQVQALPEGPMRDRLLSSIDQMESSMGGFTVAEQESIDTMIDNAQSAAEFSLQADDDSLERQKLKGEMRRKIRTNFGMLRPDGSVRPFTERELDVAVQERLGEVPPGDQPILDQLRENEVPLPEPMEIAGEVQSLVASSGSTDPTSQEREQFVREIQGQFGESEEFMDRIESVANARTTQGIREWATSPDSRTFRQAWALRQMGYYTLSDLERDLNSGRLRLPFGESGTIEAMKQMYPGFAEGEPTTDTATQRRFDSGAEEAAEVGRRESTPPTAEDMQTTRESVVSEFADDREIFQNSFIRQLEQGGRLVRMELFDLSQRLLQDRNSAIEGLRQRADNLEEMGREELARRHRRLAQLIQDNPGAYQTARDSVLMPSLEAAGIIPE